MWEGSHTFEIDKNVIVMVTALKHYKHRLETISHDKQVENLPVGVRDLLQREAKTSLELIDKIIENLNSQDYNKISSLEHYTDLLETALKIYKTDLQTVSETMASKYPGLFGHKESPNITEEIGIIDKILKEIKIKH